ncbi:Cyclin N-terminal domain-containing protein 1 [Orchesella cincta]|uniref:Cyclin N-terminal domain-containing protein 1 n=1 Tax=Orchesella cincta TaxID=48709 RepID=A0A1D2N489_ORCCI|nr:Cyclin N-terminal domain-containing protein 1 [Orchesella cincta]
MFGQGYYLAPGEAQQQHQYHNQPSFQATTMNSQRFYQQQPPSVLASTCSNNGEMGWNQNQESDFDFFRQAEQHEQQQSHTQSEFHPYHQQQVPKPNEFLFNFETASGAVEKRMGMLAEDAGGKFDNNELEVLFNADFQPDQDSSTTADIDAPFLSHSRLHLKLCETVARFRQEEESKTPCETKQDQTGGESQESDNVNLRDIPDPESYVIEARHNIKISSITMTESILSEQWNCLVENISKQQPRHVFNLRPAHVRGIFYICRTLKTNFIIRFRALELFSRYLRMFVDEFSDYFKTCNRSSFNEFMSRFETQILLRMSTCILIASKLHADTQIKVTLSVDNIKKFLKKQGLTYSCETISRSELRVLTTLDFRCHWVTPLELIEQLLSLLDLTVNSLQRAHYFCILLLEYCYIDLENIRLKFSSRIKASMRRTSSNDQISTPLQCAAIVSAALFIVSTEVKSNLHALVAKTALLPEEDVNILAIIILDLLMQ